MDSGEETGLERQPRKGGGVSRRGWSQKHCPICGRLATRPLVSNPTIPLLELHQCPKAVLAAIDAAGKRDPEDPHPDNWRTFAVRLAEGVRLLGRDDDDKETR